MSYTQVIVGTDGSATAQQAVISASRVAASLGVGLVIVTAWQRRPPDAPPLSHEAGHPGGGIAGSEATWATTTTSDGAALARQHGVEEIRQLQPVAGPGEALLSVAEDHPGALLVVGTYGLDHAAERLVGNVPHALTHHSPVDLLLTTGARTEGWHTVALSTDGSPTAARAVEQGLELATIVGARAVLLTAARDEERGRRVLEGVVQQVPATASLEQWVAQGGDVSRTLTEAAADADLLVIGNKGMSGPSRLLGSVANRITHHVPTDLLLVNTTR